MSIVTPKLRCGLRLAREVVRRVAAVRDPRDLPVRAVDPCFGFEGTLVGEGLRSPTHEFPEIVGMNEFGDALSRRHERVRRNAEDLVHLGRPPQDVALDVEIKSAHAAGA
jgi:hypothetical protein